MIVRRVPKGCIGSRGACAGECQEEEGEYPMVPVTSTWDGTAGRTRSTAARRPSRLARAGALLAAVAVPVACGGHPTEPTVPFGKGVSLYVDSLYRGKSVTLGGDVADLSKLDGQCGGSDDTPSTFDDCVSSLRIPSGWSATVYRDRKFSGASATYTADVPDLDVVTGPCKPGFNDCISSIRLVPPTP
jgi:hypothetical protein